MRGGTNKNDWTRDLWFDALTFRKLSLSPARAYYLQHSREVQIGLSIVGSPSDWTTALQNKLKDALYALIGLSPPDVKIDLSINSQSRLRSRALNAQYDMEINLSQLNIQSAPGVLTALSTSMADSTSAGSFLKQATGQTFTVTAIPTPPAVKELATLMAEDSKPKAPPNPPVAPGGNSCFYMCSTTPSVASPSCAAVTQVPLVVTNAGREQGLWYWRVQWRGRR